MGSPELVLRVPKLALRVPAIAEQDETAVMAAAERSASACSKKPALPSAGGDRLKV
jgi:hypothetical protein